MTVTHGRARAGQQELAAQLAEVTARADRLEQEVAELRARLDGDGHPGTRFAELYADFTDRFRGTAEEVVGKLTDYLPDVRRVLCDGHGSQVVQGERSEAVRVVDVGCGRGEWLGLLRDSGVPAQGIDINPDFVAAGRAAGLDMVHGDGAAELAARPAGSLDLVTAFHLVEHLDADYLLGLFAAARHALRPGGCLLLETPNPQNLAMGACNFYLDPTHRSPMPPRLTAYLVAATGFVDVEVRPLHPAETPWDPSLATQVEQVVGQALYGPRDYAVLGYRPG